MTSDTPESNANEAPAAGPSVETSADEAPALGLEAENASLKDQLLRALAETENVRRRAERDREDAAKYGVASFARDLLSVADNLARALTSLPADKVTDEGVKNLLAGIEATERELHGVFERRGMKRVNPEGQPFDANLHQAVFEVDNSGKPAGVVAQVLAPGWVIHDRLLRPAMVGVSKGPGNPPPEVAEAEPEPQRVDRKV